MLSFIPIYYQELHLLQCIYYICIFSCVYSSLLCLRIFTGLGFTHMALIQNFLCAVVCVCILTETPCVAMCSNVLQCVWLCAVVFRLDEPHMGKYTRSRDTQKTLR